MQLGLGGDMSLPVMDITAKELELRGSFRFHTEFELAVQLMQGGLVDLKPLVTHTMPVDQAEGVFLIANDRRQAKFIWSVDLETDRGIRCAVK